MTRVFTWYQLQQDEAELFNHFEKYGDFVVIPSNKSPRPQDVEEMDFREFLESNYTHGAVVARGALARFGVQAYGSAGSWTYAFPHRAESVSYQRGFVADGRLGTSNLFADWVYLSDDESTVLEKGIEFKHWASKLFNRARRYAPERLVYNGYPYLATRRAAEAFRRGEFELES